MCVYLLWVFVCLCAVYHKDVQSFGDVCVVKITHFLAEEAHVLLLYTVRLNVYVCAFVSVCSIQQRFSSFLVCAL